MRNLAIFIITLFMAGCSFRPELPEVNTTFEYKFESSDINDYWWREFKDERLNALVDDALKHNIDLKIAYINLQTAALTLKNSKADLFPTLSAEAGASKARTSGETYTGQDNIKYDSFSLSAVLNYEVDLWGRVRNSIASSDALLQASKYDYANARLTLASNVAKSYFALIALRMQEEILQKTLKSYTDTMNYRKKQLDAGTITQMVYLQSVASVQSAQINLADVKNSIIATSNALAILVGRNNNEILNEIITTVNFMPTAPQIEAGISSDILLRRSDVASAYESLKSSNALVGVARAAYFPTLSLTGVFGFSSNEFDRLFVQNANLWSLASSLTQSIFDYGKRANKVEIAKLAQSSNALKYEKTIKTALSEVRIALQNRKNAVYVAEATKDLLDSQEQIYTLAKNQFDAGYADHLTLLDAQRALLSTQLSEINSCLNLNNAIVEVYKAFGGGFKVEETTK
ncbi:efflux transporter outer membrane subunit [Campylobacter sp. faydin G-24]|uniref:Efflux transporter outer membrane subunit n=1 Tax=Campylobacter anatolicus TaxID=2829105 RepID=A0ABS5HGM2_9BACT|nr:efflux transporter outer membrane subunit [Campylobacter anatolicus]MBR8463247.1 efflux transporter outer membrane subunit [Campylobacter anatolicus]MBR8465439.1 efflux transporter outer membrane subunit [Campylobacter anatolicus]